MRVFSSSPHARLMLPHYGERRGSGSTNERYEEGGVRDYSTWSFREGDDIVAGRYATRLLGGGRRYEAYLAWDDALHALVVVKIVRPELVDSESVRRGIEGEAARSRLSTTRRSCACSTRCSTASGRTSSSSILEGPRLSTLLRRYRVVVEQFLPLALELCSALHYMHGAGSSTSTSSRATSSCPAGLASSTSASRRRPTRVSSIHAACGNRRVHGARAVRPGALLGDRSCERHLGPRRHDVRGGQPHPSVPHPSKTTGSGGARYPQLVDEPMPLGKDVPRGARGRDPRPASSGGPRTARLRTSLAEGDRAVGRRRCRRRASGSSGPEAGSPQRLRAPR